MKYTLTPETFTVKELFNPQLKENGRYYYYTLQKKGIAHSEVEKRISVRAYFAGIKDKNATTQQWFCTEEKISDLDEEEFKVKYRGANDERIYVGVHKGNAFSVIVELTREEEKALALFKPKNELVCNYFGEQRLKDKDENIFLALEGKDYETALKLFLTRRSALDSQKSKKIKELIEKKWGEWKAIAESEEICATGKQPLFDFLSKHPSQFMEAFHLAEPKSLRILIKAAQAKRFNEKLNLVAKEKKPNNTLSQIIGQTAETYAMSASKAFPRKIIIEPSEFEKNFRKSSLERKTFVIIEKWKVKKIKEGKYELRFELIKGAYATIFLKFLESWLAGKVNKALSSK